MKRKEWNFDRKGDEEPEKEPQRRAAKIRHRPIVQRTLNHHEIKGPSFGIEPQNARQHEYRRDHRVQEELDRRVNPASVSPYPDQQSHRNQSCFPKEVKQEKVQRDK